MQPVTAPIHHSLLLYDRRSRITNEPRPSAGGHWLTQTKRLSSVRITACLHQCPSRAAIRMAGLAIASVMGSTQGPVLNREASEAPLFPEAEGIFPNRTLT